MQHFFGILVQAFTLRTVTTSDQLVLFLLDNQTDWHLFRRRQRLSPRVTTVFSLSTDKEENVPTKRPVPRRTAVPKSQNLVPAESTAAPETEQPEENESCTQLLDKAPDENSSCKEDSTENVLPGGTGLSSVEEIEITEQRMDCSCNQVGTTSSSTAQPEVRDYEKCTGENLIVEKIKELISIGVQIDEEIQIESEEEFDLEEIQERMSVVSEGGSSYLSWNHLPLTGDVEVDEEIIKFYKERYKIFKEKEMT